MASQHLSDLLTKLESSADHVVAVGTVVSGLADALDGLTQDPVAIRALAEELRSKAAVIADAVMKRPPHVAEKGATAAAPTGNRPLNPADEPHPRGGKFGVGK